jgi:hypothetical protein
MRSPFATSLLLVCALAIGVAPLAGCGSTKKKKGGATIAERLKKAKDDKTPGGVPRELTKVARMQFATKDKTGAAKTLGEARKSIADDADRTVFAPRLIDIADAYAAMGDKKLARESADKAAGFIGEIEDPMAKAELYAKVGAIYAAKDGGIGDSAKGKENLKKAETLAKEEVPEGFRAKALAAVALGYADAGLAADAKDMIATLEETAESLEDLRRKAEALAAAAKVRATGGDADKAKELLTAAVKAARDVDTAANRTYALLAVGRAAKAAGDAKLAKSLAVEADKSATKIGDPEQNKEAVQAIRDFERMLEKN